MYATSVAIDRQKLVSLMRRHRLSALQLAAQSGVHNRTVYRALSAEVASLSVLDALSGTLGRDSVADIIVHEADRDDFLAAEPEMAS